MNQSETSGPSSLGELLRGERKKQGLSLRQLARLLEIDPSAIARWENDEFLPKGKYLAALARTLELQTTQLMTLAGLEYPHDVASLPAMLRAEYDLPPEAIAEVEQHIAQVARKYGASRRSLKSSKPSHEGRKP